ncbi:MAG: SOS response-associated peptidase [Clostridia bacterium]|nr:SOS response-associated peptidase [Clostridia bacterium]
MCGRFTLTRKKKDVIEEYQKRFNREIMDISRNIYSESYNIAPSQEVAVIYQLEDRLIFDYHQWGLIPYWSKDKKIGNKMINARIETIAEKPSFRDSFYNNRCLIIADGYYEWLKRGKEKIPYYFTLENHKLFAFAGIRAVWQNANEIVNSCSIITTDAVGDIADIHNRMPIILDANIEMDWIDPKLKEKKQLFHILDSRSNNDLDYYRVTTKVNNTNNNSNDLISPKNEQITLFE